MNFNDYVNEPLSFEKDLLKFYRRHEPLIIFEIGSCEGEDTIRMKKLFPESSIFTFEALPGNIKKIKNNFKRFGLKTSQVFQLALSDKNGSADFYVSSGHPDELPKQEGWDYGNKSSSLLPPKEHKKVLEWIEFKEKITVPTKRLDSFCAEKKIDKVDFVYLDVQGAELMVLRGAGDLIRKIGSIWMEVEAIELYKGQPLKSEVEKFMEKNNFIKLIDTVDNVSGDQLYINRAVHRVSPKIKLRNLLRLEGR